MLNNFIVRTGQWWQAKAGFLVSLLLLNLAIHKVPVMQGAMLMMLALVAIFGLGTLGHLINDWTDIEEDERAGKRNMLAKVGTVGRVFTLLIILCVAFLPWFVGFSSNNLIKILVIGELGLFLLYSVKPFRLKRFPRVAIFTDAVYAYVNPALFLWLSFELTIGTSPQPFAIFFLIGWTLPLGLRHILNHHVSDRENDLRSNTPNLAILIGSAPILSGIRMLLFLEICALFGFFISLSNIGRPISLVLMLAYAVLVVTQINGRFPFVKARFGELVFDRFYVTWVGLLSLVSLSLWQPTYLFAAPVFLLLFSNFFRHPLLGIIASSIPATSLRVVQYPFQVISLTFNWSLYYFRKWFLRWPEERNWGKHYALRMEQKRLDAKGNVAIFNQNYTKFSETFIGGQRHALDYRTYFYYGHPKPLMEESVGHLMGDEKYLRDLKYAFLRLMDRNVEEYEDALIADSLIANEISVIVAHFGPMAVQVMNVAEQTGIPLIAVFHGYDAWNKGQLRELEAEYSELFKTAACVVGVSKDMCSQLEKLGCDKDKITYLPAQISPVYLEPSTHIYNADELVFLSVGRFAKTKAPFLLLSAFRLVLEQLPAAKLVMVGTDDGENLFESCQMMAKAWGIADQVSFLGAISPEAVRQEMQQATVFVQHSVTTPLLGDKEGTPVGIMEAMAVGLPIVATDHAGISEMIEHEKTGILVAEYDVDSMAAAMIRFGNNVELRAQMGQAAATAIQQNKNVKENLKGFSELIDKHSSIVRP